MWLSKLAELDQSTNRTLSDGPTWDWEYIHFRFLYESWWAKGQQWVEREMMLMCERERRRDEKA
jgi:hypothetical protein